MKLGLTKYSLTMLAWFSIGLQASQIDDWQNMDSANDYKILAAGEQQFVMQRHTASGSDVKGTIILMSDPGNRAEINHDLANVLTSLSDKGWETASFRVLPAEMAKLVSAQDGELSLKSTSSSYQLDQQALTAAADNLLLQFNAVTSEVGVNRGKLIVVTEGMAANMLLNLLLERKLALPDGLVVVAPYVRAQQQNQQFAEQLHRLILPILDLTLSTDNGWSKNTRSLRKTVAKRNKRNLYRQMALPSPDNFVTQQHFAKAIYGWTRSQGW